MKSMGVVLIAVLLAAVAGWSTMRPEAKPDHDCAMTAQGDDNCCAGKGDQAAHQDCDQHTAQQ